MPLELRVLKIGTDKGYERLEEQLFDIQFDKLLPATMSFFTL